MDKPEQLKNISRPEPNKNNAELQFKLFAEDNPEEFLFVLEQGNMNYLNLILAIEASVSIENRRKLIPILFKYMYHEIPSVKEAAIYVLSLKMTKKIRKEFIKAEEFEKNEAIRSLLGSLI